MKKMQILILAMLAILIVSCTTTTTDRSYELAKAGKFDTVINHIASKETLKNATIVALGQKKWEFKNEGDAIRASIDHGGVSARLYITFEKDLININSKGSNINGTPIVPIRYIHFLEGHIKKELAKNK